MLFFATICFATVQYPSSYFPPVIKQVSIYPEQPKSGQEIKVSATILSSNEDITEADLSYSTNNGETWQKIEMEQSGEKQELWLGTIPAHNAETKIIFYISCMDSAGNVSSELPAQVGPREKKDDQPSWLPVNNSMALIDSDENDDDRETPPEFDLLSVYAGVDETYLYLTFTFEGKILSEAVAQGTLNVPLYQISLSNVDTKDDVETKYGHNYLYYSALAPTFIQPGPICGIGMYDAGGRIRASDWKEVDCFVENQHSLFMRITRKDIKNNPKQRVKLFFSSGIQNKLPCFHCIEPLDISGNIYLYFTFHSFQIEE